MRVSFHVWWGGQKHPVEEEIELGQIQSLKQRRLATASWAESLIPLLAEARLTLPTNDGTREPARSAYASWLNLRKVPTRRNRQWTSQAVIRLFDLHHGLIDEAELEFDIEFAIIQYKRGYVKHLEGRQALDRRQAAAEQDRAKQINNSRRLTAALRGLRYVDQDVPLRMRMKRKSRSKPLTEERPAPVDEVQLPLFSVEP